MYILYLYGRKITDNNNNKMLCSYYSSSSDVENLQLIVHVIMSWNALMQILHELCLMAKKFDNQGFVYVAI